MSINQLNITDLQFLGSTDTAQKLRRLVQDLQAAERAVNGLLQAVANLPDDGGNGPFVFANPALTPTFKVSNLHANDVLQALTPTSAKFGPFALEQLSDVSISAPNDGQVLTRFHGEWINQDVPSGGGAMGVNLGTGEDIYAGISGGKLAFYTIEGDGSVTVTLEGETLVLSAPTPAAPSTAASDAMAYFNGF